MPPTKTPSKTAAKPAAKAPAKEPAKDAKASPAKSAKDSKPEPKAAAPVAAAKPAAGAKPAAKADAKPERTEKQTREEPLTMPKIPVAAAAAEPERVSITTTMSKTQLARFRKLLEEKRDDIIKKAKETLEEDMTLDTNDLPDEMDLASSEYLQSFTFRLRGREKSFLDKITKALERIDNGTFGVCEECGDEISVKRLEARPETTLCIRCKEDQERAEKDYG
jgi:DnaK suppressor protein